MVIRPCIALPFHFFAGEKIQPSWPVMTPQFDDDDEYLPLVLSSVQIELPTFGTNTDELLPQHLALVANSWLTKSRQHLVHLGGLKVREFVLPRLSLFRLLPDRAAFSRHGIS